MRRVFILSAKDFELDGTSDTFTGVDERTIGVKEHTGKLGHQPTHTRTP